jgi:branched-chain amino acid transport system ATP-binding protein
VSDVLRVEGVSRRFGGLQALKDVSFSVPTGSATAVIGPNGAGKTTLLDVITGFTRPDTGQVTFDGRLITHSRPQDLASHGLMRTFQSARLVPRLTVRENLMLGAHHLGSGGMWAGGLRLPRSRRQERAMAARADAALRFLELTRFADSLAAGLPAGTQRIIEVGRVLVGSPRLVLFDEPAAGLDDTETLELADVLRAVHAHEISMVLIEHNVGLVMSVSDAVLVMDAGAPIAHGTPVEVMADPAVIAAYLGENAA